MKLLRIAFIIPLVTACASSGTPLSFERIIEGKSFMRVSSEPDCVAAGGVWRDISEQIAAQDSLFTCILPTTDGGNACSSSSECQSLCELAPGQDVEIGQSASGQCMATYFHGGCRSYVHRGRFATAFCSE
jgi:hypothetical protein